MTVRKQKQSPNSHDAWYRQAAGMALAVGAGALASPDAAAGTVFTDVSSLDIVTTGGGGQQSIYFSLFTTPGQQGQVLLGGYSEDPFGGGAEDTPDWTQFILGRYGNWASFQGEAYNNAVGDLAVEVYPNPFNLSAGAFVGAGSPFVGENWGINNIQTLAGSSLQYGHFTVPDAGYLGLRFSPDNGENFYYGWAEIEVGDPDVLPATPANIRLLGFAYNDQVNEPIQAGGDALIPGDANHDGVVSGADYTIWSDNFGGFEGDATFFDGDFNGDGLVTGADYTIWSDNFGREESPFIGPDQVGAVQPTAVPEPASTTLLLLGAAGLGAYRARRSDRKGKHASQA